MIRILVSRNKREGGYSGTSAGKHVRAGNGAFAAYTLREWSRA